MDIKSGCGYLASSLSNFAPHPFIFDVIEIASAEGFLCNTFEGLLQSYFR